MSKKHYIYVREHEAYKLHNAVKLGITSCIAERDAVYKTGEINRGCFKMVLCINSFNNDVICNNKLRFLERLIQNYLKDYKVFVDGGSEFFKEEIVDLIIPYLDKLNIVYNVLTLEDIDRLLKLYKLKLIIHSSSAKITNILKKWLARIKNRTVEIIQPIQHQIEILDKIEEFYKNNDIGQIHWACGLGKALLAIFIVKKLECKNILIGVPSIYLQRQIKKEILRVYTDSNNNIL